MSIKVRVPFSEKEVAEIAELPYAGTVNDYIRDCVVLIRVLEIEIPETFPQADSESSEIFVAVSMRNPADIELLNQVNNKRGFLRWAVLCRDELLEKQLSVANSGDSSTLIQSSLPSVRHKNSTSLKKKKGPKISNQEANKLAGFLTT